MRRLPFVTQPPWSLLHNAWHGRSFLAYGKLVPHETVRARNELVMIDTFDEFKEFVNRHIVVFISHRERAWPSAMAV